MDKSFRDEFIKKIRDTGNTDPENARWFADLGDTDTAKLMLLKHIKDFPEDSDAYQALMEIFIKSPSSLKDAKRLWECAQKANIEGHKGYYLTGILYADAIKNDQLMDKLLNEAIIFVPDSVTILNIYTHYLVSKGNILKAGEAICNIYKYYKDINFKPSKMRELRLITHFFIDLALKNGDLELIKDIFAEAPSIIQWDIRINSHLWCLIPDLSIDTSFRDLSINDAISLARALIASERIDLAKAVLMQFESTSPAKTYISELIADCNILVGKYSEAGEEYLRIICEHSAKGYNLEAPLCKAARAFFSASNWSTFDYLFSGFGPSISIRGLNADNIDFRRTIGKAKDVSERAQAVLLILEGIKHKNLAIMFLGLGAFDPYSIHEISEPISSAEYVNIMFSLIDADKKSVSFKEINLEKLNEIPQIRNFLSFLDRIYLLESIIFPAEERNLDESIRNEKWRQTSYTRVMVGLLMGEEMGLKSFAMRTREGIALGMEAENFAVIVEDTGKTPFEEWIRKKKLEYANTRSGVYLEKLNERSLGAESIFHQGLIAAFHDYQFEKGAQMIHNSLIKDPLNVSALIALAEIKLIQKNYIDSRIILQKALELDPIHPKAKCLKYCLDH